MGELWEKIKGAFVDDESGKPKWMNIGLTAVGGIAGGMFGNGNMLWALGGAAVAAFGAQALLGQGEDKEDDIVKDTGGPAKAEKPDEGQVQYQSQQQDQSYVKNDNTHLPNTPQGPNGPMVG